MGNEHFKTAERPARVMGGIGMLLVGLAIIVAGPVIIGMNLGDKPVILSGLAVSGVGVLFLTGLYSLQPNEAVAIMLFGAYRGTDRTNGLRWVLPWYSRKKVSVRVRNLTSDKLKVNDKRGNPIEIAANVVWRVEDSARYRLPLCL